MCLFKWKKKKKKNQSGGSGICVFLDATRRVSLGGKQPQACVLLEDSYWALCWTPHPPPSSYSDDDLGFVKCPSACKQLLSFP